MSKDEKTKSGYDYLKEKVASMEKEMGDLNIELEDLEKQNRLLEKKVKKVENENERATFERLVVGIKTLMGWR